MLSLLSQRITSYRKDKEAIIDGIEMHFTWPGGDRYYSFTWGRSVLQFHLGEVGITVSPGGGRYYSFTWGRSVLQFHLGEVGITVSPGGGRYYSFTWGRSVLQFHLGEAGIAVNVQPSYRNECTRWDICTL